MRPLNLGIEMDQGADFELVVMVRGSAGPIDLTGYHFLAEMKSLTDPLYPVVAEFDFSILDQSTHKGQFKWSLPASDVDTIVVSVANPLQKQRLTTPFIFDLKMKDTSSKIQRIIQGIIYVSPEVTEESFT